MRFKHFKPSTLTEEQLDELRMNPTTLQQFAASPEAQGIQAGFEAELVFTGLGGEPDYDQDPEPDYDADERCRSIDQVIDFFSNDEYGYGTYGRDLEKLQEGMDEKYYEWVDERMWDAFRDEQEDLVRKIWVDERPMSERIHDALTTALDKSDAEADSILAVGEAAPRFTKSSDQEAYASENPDYEVYLEALELAEAVLEEDVEESIRKQDGYYDSALDDFRDNFYVDDDSGFFGDVGWRWMSDIAEEFGLMWPVITYTGASSEGGFNEDAAERLADDLHEKLGVQTKVSSGYHSAKRDNKTWIFEPDSSLDADDSDNMPVEIVSPPMPLEECLRQMENFFTWAEDNGAYANSSTGFHMGVSLPHTGGNVDYVKLALFLGDEHVLREFGRSGNHFCEAAIKKIRSRVRGNKEAVSNALELMRHNLIELAQKSLEINNHGFGKYTSINPQGGQQSNDPSKQRGAKYIEFRSAGGSNYFEDIDKLKNTLLRYAQAMHIASRPDLERREYYKKLYKLIAPKEGDPELDLFARFATGAISAEELKKTWAEKALEKDAPQLSKKSTWVLYDKAAGKTVQGQQYSNYTYDEALAKAKQAISPGSTEEGFTKQYDLIDTETNTGRWSIVDKDTGETLEVVDAETKGAAADQVYDKYTKDGGGFFVRPYVEFDQPTKLSRRAKLAKAIKAPKPDWNVVYRPTGRVVDVIHNVSREEAQKLLVKVAQQHQFDSVDDLEIHNKADADRAEQQKLDSMPKWEIYSIRNGHVFHTINSDSQQDAEAQAQQWYRDNHVSNDQQASFGLRQKTTTQQTYSNYADAQRAADQQNQQSTNPNPTLQDPNQARAPNGVPMWEIYQRDTGHSVHTFADHTQREAWAQAQQWLRNMGAEDPSLFSVRPKMNTNESIADRVFEEFDSYFKSVMTPVKKRLK